MNSMGIKELYGMVLKTTSIMEINGQKYEKNEPIISFDKIQIGLLNEEKKRSNASGGYNNQSLILWEDTKSMGIQLSEGVISKNGLSILSNSRLLDKSKQTALIPFNEELNSVKEEGENILYTKHLIHDKVFVYRNGIKYNDFSCEKGIVNSKIILHNITEDDSNSNYTIYYDYEYINKKMAQLSIGTRAVKTFLSMTGRVRVKDDQTGKETTCLLEFPKVELTSDLTMRLGSEVNPYVYGFSMRAHPVGERGNQYVCRYTFLDEDIDCDF